MVQFNPRQHLPTQDELPETDFAPVDSELQTLVASLLGDILAWHWRDRSDWFWGINLGVYYKLNTPAIVPDGFLSLGVEQFDRSDGRQSYVVWHEGALPLLVVEYVSRSYGQEYGSKLADYASIGVLYYVIYNPVYCRRKRRQPLEIYRLEGDRYVLLEGDPVWLPEIGLGLGREFGTYRNCQREWLYWYDREGNRLTAPAEVAERENLRAEQEALRAEQALRAQQASQRAEREALRQAQQASQRAEREALLAQQEALRAEQESQRAEQESQRAEQESQRAERERQLREHLLNKLRQKGIDPNTL
ncbi:Uma2 family endonuclease [Synechococcus sp. PCC 7336]|uniref:Uma2 family endonuclease n=1 Tax=Synechococcus sp. PCC 7336 TaxID=195250 RepID=UPI0003475326|nr:Uma2 family endonuclease [Synechococcus sp. PCC 7336]